MTQEPYDDVDPDVEPAVDPAVDPAGEPSPEHERVRTGVGQVDSVVDDVAALESRPLEEHVPVFEDVHERLRRALDQPDGPTSDPS